MVTCAFPFSTPSFNLSQNKIIKSLTESGGMTNISDTILFIIPSMSNKAGKLINILLHDYNQPCRALYMFDYC